MKKLLLSIALLSLAACASTPDPQEIADKRAEIDAMESATLTRLFEESSGAKRLYDECYAYAVFSNVKVSLILTGGGGKGVIVQKASKSRTYMNMGMGATKFTPDGDLDSKTKFSLSFGGGVKKFFTKRIGFRSQIRGFLSFLGTDDEIYCDHYGCWNYEKSVNFTQIEISSGLVFAL